MDLTLLDYRFRPIKLIDNYISLIWNVKYNEVGNFELYMDATKENVALFQGINDIFDLYIQRSDRSVMVVEKMTINTDDENGNKLIVTGKSLESLLDRIIPKETVFLNGNLYSSLNNMVRSNLPVFNDVGQARPDAYVLLNEEKQDEFNDKLTSQYSYKTIYAILTELCKRFNYGFKLSYQGLYFGKNIFEFGIYKGKDLSLKQSKNNQVIFSPKFDNIISSEFVLDKENLRTNCLVKGSGEGEQRLGSEASLFNLPQKEMMDPFFKERWIYLDDRNEVLKDGANSQEKAAYLESLKAHGLEELNAHRIECKFEAVVDTTSDMYVFGNDYQLGDVVQFENEYGMSGLARIVEVIENHSSNGYTIIPTFKSVNLGGN